MKILVSAFLILTAAVSAASAQDFYGADDVKFFREAREKEFRNPHMSPLRPEDLPKFQGLNYFPIDRNYRVAAKFTATPGEQFFWMPTSSAGRSQKYVRVGVLKFKLDGRDLALNAYQSERVLLTADEKLKSFRKKLFVPFRDLTSGRETYGVGRYLYLTMTANSSSGGGGSGEEITLDFNLAFNPSCAYGSESFSCPIPPKDNFLEVEIKAGEKIYSVKKQAVTQK